ncbi:hypothetical protein [Endozoicomonas arenosclerae]|nr:hypothetical protein [Endozoicomonas arenosclerae]
MMSLVLKETVAVLSSVVVLLFFLSVILLADLFVDPSIQMEHQIVDSS